MRCRLRTLHEVPAFSVYAVHDYGDGSVARHVAGGAEAVHGDVEGNHQGLGRLVEAEHSLEHTQCSHDGTAGNPGCGDHGDAEHEDEAAEIERVYGYAGHHHDGHGAGGDFHRAARQVYGGAQGNNKGGDVFAHPVFKGLGQRDRYGGCRRLGAQRRGVGGQHVLEQAQGILAGYESGQRELDE